MVPPTLPVPPTVETETQKTTVAGQPKVVSNAFTSVDMPTTVQPKVAQGMSASIAEMNEAKGSDAHNDQHAARRLRGGGAGKDCFLGIFGCFVCFECCEGCCDCVADIICCPCEMCC